MTDVENNADSAPADLDDPVRVDDDELGPIPGLDDSPPDDDPTVPLSRFQEMVRDRDEERQARQRLEGRLEALEKALPGEPTPAPRASPAPGERNLDGLPTPPSGLDTLQQAYWHIGNGVDRFLPEALERMGIPVKALQEHAGKLPELAQSSVERAWSQACADEGVPDNAVTRGAFLSLTGSGMSPKAALAEIKGTVSTPRRSPRATPMTSGAAHTPTVERIVPRDREHATKLALAGKRVPEFGIFDALKIEQRKRGA